MGSWPLNLNRLLSTNLERYKNRFAGIKGLSVDELTSGHEIAIEDAALKVFTYCNLESEDEIPKALDNVVVDIAWGLYTSRLAINATVEDIDADAKKSLSLGDMSYSRGTRAETVKSAQNASEDPLTGYYTQLNYYRVLRW